MCCCPCQQQSGHSRLEVQRNFALISYSEAWCVGKSPWWTCAPAAWSVPCGCVPAQTFALDLGLFVEEILRQRRILPRGLAHPAIFEVLPSTICPPPGVSLSPPLGPLAKRVVGVIPWGSPSSSRQRAHGAKPSRHL